MSKQPTYNELNDELGKVLDTLQADDIDIDTAVTAYSRGMELIQELEDVLKQAQNKVEKIQQQWDKTK